MQFPLIMCIIRVNKSLPKTPPPSRPHTDTHAHINAETHAQTHIRRCWIVLNQPTYTDDFCHQAEHSYIAGPYTIL